MFEKLKNNRRLTANLIAGSILVFMFLLAFYSSKGIFGHAGDSGTVDEVAHIPSGFSYDKYFDYRLNPEHPPLAKALAGVPLVLKGFNGPKDDWSWNGINQWEAGWYMLYEAGNDPAAVLIWARFPMMLLMLGLGVFLFKWACELYGRKVGLIVLLLYAFYPDVIAHGRLVTTDIAAAFGYVISIYYFDKMLQNQTRKTTAIAALAFGIAQLLKFSSFLLFGVLLMMVVLKAYLERKEGFWPKFWQYLKGYIAVCVLSLIVVWIVYIPFVWKTPSGIEHELIERNLTADPKTLIFRNFLHFFEGNPITRAIGHYILGIFLVVARVGGGNNTFALGHVSDKSISWFFPFAWLVKTPLSIILLIFWSLAAMVQQKLRFGSKENTWRLWIIMFPILVYWGFTLKGQLNIGIRHLMPTVPFALLLIGWLIYELFQSQKLRNIKLGAVAILALFMIYHTLSYFPQYISYFNVLVPKDQRYKYLVDSSLDWGQDLLRLKEYVDKEGIKDIKIDYFGGSVPSYYIPQGKGWHSSYGPTTGWLAVSATFYQSSKLVAPKEGKWSYGWLDDQKPQAIIGGSILVFNITDQDLRDYPPVSPYPITQLEYPSSIIETPSVVLH